MSRLAATAKHAAFAAARYSGMNWLSRGVFRNRLLIACYHGVVPGEHPDDFNYRNTVSVRAFRKQLEFLMRRFRPVSAADIRNWIEGRTTLPKNAVFVTFDDGYKNNLTHAAPILERYGVPALIHVTTGYVGETRLLWAEEVRLRVMHWPGSRLPMPGGASDLALDSGPAHRWKAAEYVRRRCKQLPLPLVLAYLDRLREARLPEWSARQVEDLLAFLSWDDVRALRNRGFEIGSHTVEHVILSQTRDAALHSELAESKAAIERETGRECYCIAYPNGTRDDFNPAVLDAVRAAGYCLGFTMTGDLNRDAEDPLALSRVNIPGHVPEEVVESRLTGMQTLIEAFVS